MVSSSTVQQFHTVCSRSPGEVPKVKTTALTIQALLSCRSHHAQVWLFRGYMTHDKASDRAAQLCMILLEMFSVLVPHTSKYQQI